MLTYFTFIPYVLIIYFIIYNLEKNTPKMRFFLYPTLIHFCQHLFMSDSNIWVFRIFENNCNYVNTRCFLYFCFWNFSVSVTIIFNYCNHCKCLNFILYVYFNILKIFQFWIYYYFSFFISYLRFNSKKIVLWISVSYCRKWYTSTAFQLLFKTLS